MTASAAPSGVREQIEKAARVPYEALAHRDAPAFCRAFTPTAVAEIVAGAPPTATCPVAVSELIAKTSANQPNGPVIPPAAWHVTNIVWQGAYASASVRYGNKSLASLVLRKVDHRWLITTRMRLVPITGCSLQGAQATDCPNGTHVVIALIELPTAGQGPTLPLIPASVRRAGARKLSEFKQGRIVFAQSGCEACHRIGIQGNPGPGPDLTHIGSKLVPRAIEHAIVDPTQPMPSFKNLPRAKFHALVRFLSLLR